jgi:hypothetical protein
VLGHRRQIGTGSLRAGCSTKIARKRNQTNSQVVGQFDGLAGRYGARRAAARSFGSARDAFGVAAGLGRLRTAMHGRLSLLGRTMPRQRATPPHGQSQQQGASEHGKFDGGGTHTG